MAIRVYITEAKHNMTGHKIMIINGHSCLLNFDTLEIMSYLCGYDNDEYITDICCRYRADGGGDCAVEGASLPGDTGHRDSAGCVAGHSVYRHS